MIQNVTNRDVYIGSSKSIYYRIARHKGMLLAGTHPNRNLQNSWNEFGRQCFRVSVLERCPSEELNQVEQKYIDLLKPNLNITLDVLNNTPSEESRKMISDTLKVRYANGELKTYRQDHAWKTVYQYSQNLEPLGQYTCVADITKRLNLSKNSILNVIDKVGKKGNYRLAGGFIWRSAPFKPGEFRETLEADNPEPS